MKKDKIPELRKMIRSLMNIYKFKGSIRFRQPNTVEICIESHCELCQSSGKLCINTLNQFWQSLLEKISQQSDIADGYSYDLKPFGWKVFKTDWT